MINTAEDKRLIENRPTENKSSHISGTRPAFNVMAQGERKELLLEVESEQIIDARRVEIKMKDGANRRYIWVGTTGIAARLRPNQVVLLKGTADKIDRLGIHLKHCRIVEIA